MIRLQQYLLAAAAKDIDNYITNWRQSERLFQTASQQFTALAKGCGDAFSESSYTASAAASNYNTASAEMLEKAHTIGEARRAMSRVAERYELAQTKYDEHEGKLPTSHGPAPSASDPEYTTEGYSGFEKVGREAALSAAKAQHAAEAQAIADAEREAAFQCQQIDEGNQDAEPKVRAITEPPSSSSNTNGSGSSGSSGGYSSPGSRSAVNAAQARHDSVNPGTLYADGDGYQIRSEQQAIIKQAHAENIPEWDSQTQQWVNSDGSPAPATSYASVETAEGLAPLAGGTGGMAALGIGLGGAGLGAAAVAAIKAKFGAGAAAAAASKVSAAGSPAKAGMGRAAGAAPKAGAAGQGARSGGSGMRGAGGRGTGAGSRGQMRGAGTGAGGRGGKGKDKQNGATDPDLIADYSADYSDDEYERLMAQKRFDDEQKRQFRGRPEEPADE
ncbi:hypothetical protein [Nocardioides sp. NPDC047086]|uniref:hypothetical protein n=1 Tax=Nocardioides sp. NPDC047086 TaxID=3154810 RepID=UPI003407678F